MVYGNMFGQKMEKRQRYFHLSAAVLLLQRSGFPYGFDNNSRECFYKPYYCRSCQIVIAGIIRLAFIFATPISLFDTLCCAFA